MEKLNGVLLAGGLGTRLIPNTLVVNKHLLPIYDKPMIFYSLSLLMLAGIKNITIVCNKKDLEPFNNLLGQGDNLGIEISYSVQDNPDGIPHAINTALENTEFDKTLVVLGDNFIYGRDFFLDLKNIMKSKTSISIFSQHVKNPEKFGVIKSSENGAILDIVEKPIDYISNDVVVGVYIIDKKFKSIFKNLIKSERGEFEIVDVIKGYGLENVSHQKIGRGTAWFDMGSFDSFYNCSSFVKTLQDRLGLLICSPHEIAFNNGWIDSSILKKYILQNTNSDYANNLKYLIR